MLEHLFTYPAVLARHKKAPLFEERDCYLAYRAKDGCARQTLLRTARELLQIVQVLDIPSTPDIKPKHIKSAADRWAREQCRRGRAHTLKWSRRLFIQVATDWLHFLGRLDQLTVAPPSFEGLLKDFAHWMDSERGLSLRTIHNYSWHVKKFLRWCENHNQSAYTVEISDVDTFLASCGNGGWNRVSVASAAKALKAFFRCAEKCGWPLKPIASAIQGPRLFSQENLPCGPTWENVRLMIDHLTTDGPQDIRDRAIILLFAVYGLRSSEVSGLTLEDIDWENNRISVYRPKQRRTQIYPLTPVVGNAIIRYLKYVRPQSFFHEVFLTVKAPIKYLSAGGLYNIVNRCMSNIGLHSMHRGPHALRHACAMHLVTEGLSIKEIGDHLGHRSTSATRIYAKVNLPQLRLVADVDLGGLS